MAPRPYEANTVTLQWCQSLASGLQPTKASRGSREATRRRRPLLIIHFPPLSLTPHISNLFSFSFLSSIRYLSLLHLTSAPSPHPRPQLFGFLWPILGTLVSCISLHSLTLFSIWTKLHHTLDPFSPFNKFPYITQFLYYLRKFLYLPGIRRFASSTVWIVAFGCIPRQRLPCWKPSMGNTETQQIVHSGCSGDIREGSFARNVSAFWASRGDFFFSDYGSVLALPNIMEVNAAGKLIFVSVSSSTTLFRCREDWMARGLQPQCQTPGDKRFPNAFGLYVSPSHCNSPQPFRNSFRTLLINQPRKDVKKRRLCIQGLAKRTALL